MKKVSRIQAIEDFRKMFEISDISVSRESEGKFHISKTEFERFDVIGKLNGYFIKNEIDGYCVTLDPLTFVFTSFQVIPISELQKTKQ